MNLLEGLAAIVTGAGSRRGLGQAVARLFAEHGARVALLDIDGGAAEERAREIGGDHLGIACDVTDAHACRSAADRTLEAFGRIDVLVNNAGITEPIRIMDVRRESYERVLDVNLRGTMLMSQAVIPHMRERRSGALVNMSSVSAQRGGGIFGGPHYAAAKAGVLGLTKAMARELGPDNIRVNAICPSLIDTDITAGKLTSDQLDQIVAAVPLARAGEAREVAGAALFLASDLSSYVTGAEIDVNGGSHIH